MSEASECLRDGIIGLAVGAAAIVILSPLITPAAMSIGIIAAPIFGVKALCHKIALKSLKNKKPFVDLTAHDKNELKKLVQEKRMLQSLDKARGFGLCIIPFGFLLNIIKPPLHEKRIGVLNKAIADHKRLHPKQLQNSSY